MARLTLVLQPKGLNIDSDRYRGFIETLSKAGKSADPDQMFTRIHTMEDGKRVLILRMRSVPAMDTTALKSLKKLYNGLT